MSTNLINNYKNQNMANNAGYSSAQNLNKNKTVHKPISGLKPSEGKGHLVKSSLIDAPLYMAKDFAYDIKSLKNGFSGKSNDHQLGKINDIGMKVGGLAVATYLFTKKQTPLTKSMEFMGFASFFASMALWPKIALQLPAYLAHGFNVQQNYVDSAGRKKPFFQDPQYTPWDLYSDKQINKIGNKLGVPKDIPNRRDFIQEKMKKIALQNNTMWMLTAGFATPIMSALICNQAEKLIAPAQNKNKNKNADKSLKNLEEHAEKWDFKDAEKRLNNLFETNSEKPFTEDLISNIADVIAPKMNGMDKDKIIEDLKNVHMSSDSKISELFVDGLIENYSTKAIGRYSENKIHLENAVKSIPTKEMLMKHLSAGKLLEAEATDAEMVRESLRPFIKQHILDNCPDRKMHRQLTDISHEAIENTIVHNPVNKFTLAAKQHIEQVAKILQNHMKKAIVLDNYAVTKVADAPETVLANEWNEIADSLPKLFKITSKEADAVKNDRLLVQDLMRTKMEKIASNDELYSKVITEIAKKLKKLDEVIKPNDIDVYIKEIDTLYNATAEGLSKLGMDKMSMKVAGIFGNENDEAILKKFADNKIEVIPQDLAAMKENGSIKRLQKVFVDDRLSGVKNSYYRLISTLDLYRRAAVQDLGEIGKDGKFIGCLAQEMKQEVREEIIEVSKQVSLFGHTSDEATKYFFRRNPQPDLKPGEMIKTEFGKVISQFSRNHTDIIYDKVNGVDMPQDYNFYKNSMDFRFKNDMNTKTTEALKEVGLFDKIAAYRTRFYEEIGGSEYFAKASHDVTEKMPDIDKIAEGPEKVAAKALKRKLQMIKRTNFEQKFLLSGLAIDEMFANVINKAQNTNKWLKMFGGIGAGLLAVTVASQLFFGKMDNPQKVNKG